MARGLSIVLPCYNRGAYLSHWLAAFAWWQPYDLPIEVLVIDDGGADHAAAVVERWQERGVDVRYLRLRAPGGPRNNAQARNAGIRAARYPLVLQSDPDIVFATDVVRHFIAAWRPGTFCSVTGYYPLTRCASRELWRCSEQRPLAATDYLTRIVGRPNLVRRPDGVYGLHGAFLCDAETLVHLRGYDERFHVWGWEDRDLLTRLEDGLGFTRQFVADTTVVHQWHPALRADDGPDRSRVLWQMGWQQACATAPGLLVCNSERWGEASSAFASGARPADRTHAFEAYLHEARVWRREGQPRVALERLQVALSRWWEWGDAEASDRSALATQIALARAAGESKVDELAIEYARAAADAGDRRRAEIALEAIADRPGVAPAAANICAQWLIADGRLEAAAQLLEHALTLSGESGPAIGRTEAVARLIEVLVRLDRRGAALQWADTALAEAGGTLDLFERLLLEGYRVRLSGKEHDVEGAGEFLFSVAMRARRDDLPFGALAMFEAYLALSEGAEDDLRTRAIQHRDEIREAIGGGTP